MPRRRHRVVLVSQQPRPYRAPFVSQITRMFCSWPRSRANLTVLDTLRYCSFTTCRRGSSTILRSSKGTSALRYHTKKTPPRSPFPRYPALDKCSGENGELLFLSCCLPHTQYETGRQQKRLLVTPRTQWRAQARRWDGNGLIDR